MTKKYRLRIVKPKKGKGSYIRKKKVQIAGLILEHYEENNFS